MSKCLCCCFFKLICHSLRLLNPTLSFDITPNEKNWFLSGTQLKNQREKELKQERGWEKKCSSPKAIGKQKTDFIPLLPTSCSTYRWLNVWVCVYIYILHTHICSDTAPLSEGNTVSILQSKNKKPYFTIYVEN